MVKHAKTVFYKDQKYSTLYKSQQKIIQLYVDPLFTAIPPSIGSFSDLPEDIEWKRPKELCESPCLCTEEANPSVIVPGKLSSKWFVSACTVLIGTGALHRKVIPNYWKQEWDVEKTEKYSGIFYFRFWRFGDWVEVVVDDLLPTYQEQLLCTHTNRPNEFWISLVEKAYAKLHGSYQALQDGHLADALVDFTGGLSEVLDLTSENYVHDDERRASLIAMLTQELHQHSLVCSTIAVSDPKLENTRTEMGLYQGCVYAVNAIKKVHLGETNLRTLFKGRGKITLVRVREPFEDNSKPSSPSKSENTDDEKSKESYVFSTFKLCRLLSKNPHWAKVTDSERHRLGLTCDSPLDIWMPFEDFVSNFTELTICRMYNTNLFALSRKWNEEFYKGQWCTGVKGTSSDCSGGDDTFPDTFLRNPQYMFDIKHHEQEFVLQMLQWDPSWQYQESKNKLLISFYIIKVEENRKYRLHKQWAHNPTVVSHSSTQKREIFYQGHLLRGRYIILPTTHKPGDIGGYFIRTFTSSDINLRALKMNIPRKKCFCLDCLCLNYPLWVTVIVIKGAENVMKFGSVGSSDPFCVIKCEGKTVQTQVVKNTTHPTWDVGFVFYRRKIDVPIVIQVYSHNTIMPNKFAGQVQLPAPLNNCPTLLHADLMGKEKTEGEPLQGTLSLDIYTTDNFWTV